MAAVEHLAARRSELSADQLTLLAKRIRGVRTEPSQTIDIAPGDCPLVLSFSQERIWFLEQLQSGTAVHNQHACLDVSGRLDCACLQASLNALVERHDILGMTFPSENGLPAPRHTKGLQAELSIIDLEGEDVAAAILIALQRAQVDVRRSFDLSVAPLFRAVLYRVGPDRHILLLVTHHLLFDGWSLGIAVRELGAAYDRIAAGEAPFPSQTSLRYRDFAHWQRLKTTPEFVNTESDYWRAELGGGPHVLELPTDRPRPMMQTFEGATFEFEIAYPLATDLKLLSKRAGVTLFMTLVTAFQILLHRYSGQEAIIVGCPMANRSRPELADLLGVFINTLPFRADFADDPSALTLLGRAKRSTAAAFARQDLPFEKLVQELDLPRDFGRTPLCQAMFVLQNAPMASLHFGGLDLTWLSLTGQPSVIDPISGEQWPAIDTGTSKCDLCLFVTETPRGMAAAVEYDSALFDDSTVARMFANFRTLLHGIVDDPDASVSRLSLLSDVDTASQVGSGEDRSENFTAAHDLIAARAHIAPAAAAVAAPDGEATYGELNDRANWIAHYLLDRGLRPSAVVGVCLERGTELIATLLGVLKAGATYLPLDPDYPQDRLASMLQAAGVDLIMTHMSLRDRLPAIAVPVVCCDPLSEDLQAFPTTDPGLTIGADHLAYVIYTSGSSGLPKGVEISHGALANLLTSMAKRPGLSAADVLLAVTSISFDIAALELFLPLCVGARTVVVDQAVAMDGVLLGQAVRDSAATVMQATPTTWRMLLDAGWRGASTFRVLCGGEPMTRELADRLLDCAATVWNLYGPTETTIWSAIEKIEVGTSPVLIGLPIDHTRLYVLDADLRMVPRGVVGDLWIGGAGLARGYREQPDLTRNSFCTDPHVQGDARMYRTGDLARQMSDGRFMCLGRRDRQVKVRGFRIELGDVEAALGRCDNLKECCVDARAGCDGNVELVAYVVPDNVGLDDDTRVWRALVADFVSELREILPSHMVPTQWVHLAALPQTLNRKVDYRALPSPDPVDRSHNILGTDAPRNETEAVLTTIWRDVLRTQPIGIFDNFFSCGGHSLNAAQLLARVYDAFGCQLKLRTLFAAPTIAEMAKIIVESSSDRDRGAVIVKAEAARHEPFPLTEVQQAYWLGRGTMFELGGIGAHVYFEIEQTDLDIGRLERVFNRLVARHDMLRSIVTEDGQQRVIESVPPYRIDVLDLRAETHVATSQALVSWRAEQSHRIFSSTEWPLFRITAARLPDDRTRLAIGIDMQIADGHSLGILGRELEQLYADEHTTLPLLDVSFRDYVLAVAQMRGTDAAASAREYWLDRITTLPDAPKLPLAPIAATSGPSRFVRRSAILDAKAWGILKQQARHAGLTPSVVLLTAFSKILERWSEAPRFSINVTLFNRLPLHADVRSIVGDFTSLTLLAVEPDHRASFVAQARAVQKQLWSDLDHGNFSGVQVLRELGRRNGNVMAALMPVVFTSLIADGDEASTIDGLFAKVDYAITQTPQVHLDCQVREQGGTLQMSWDVIDERFPTGLIDAMFRAATDLLRDLSDGEGAWHRVGVPNLPAEQQAVRAMANATVAPVHQATLCSLWREGAQLNGGAPAMISRAGYLSHDELRTHVDRVGLRLQGLGIVPDRLVGVMMEKGWEQVVAVLGIHAAGGAYLPIDPALPRARIAYLLESGQVDIVLTQSWLAHHFDIAPATHWLTVDLIANWPQSAGVPDIVNRPGDLAYVIHTSGSTGNPKGVAIDHQAAVNTIIDINERFGVGPSDRVLALSSLSFDLSVYDIFGAMAAGAAIVVPSNNSARNPQAWAALMTGEGVTVWNSVPALMEMLVEFVEGDGDGEGAAALAGLRLILLSGDWISPSLVQRLRVLAPTAQIVGLGGATEAAIWSIFHPIDHIDATWRSIPYGRPLRNQRFYVLDDALAPKPDWVAGELYIGGAGLARCYWEDTQTTAERFITNPATAERLYRTGDFGRYWPSGEIEFLGRQDQQVKIRGRRIELGEIESVFGQYPDVREAIVGVVDDPGGRRHLVAYLVATGSVEPIDADHLRQYLHDRLPAELVPGTFVFLDSMPLSGNGKIDRKALVRYAPPPRPSVSPTLKGNEAERRVAAIVEAVLERSGIGLTDNFFDLGFDSVLLVRLYNQLRRDLHVEFPIVELFTNPTVAAVAAFIAAGGKTSTGLAARELHAAKLRGGRALLGARSRAAARPAASPERVDD